MRSNYTILFFIKKNQPKKNGKFGICGRITLNGKSANFSTQMEIEFADWMAKGGKAIGRNSSSVNKNLNAIRNKINECFWELFERGEIPDVESIKNLLFGVTQMGETLLKLFDEHNEQYGRGVGITTSQSTFARYMRTRRFLAEYIQSEYKMSDLHITKVNRAFIEDFDTFLRITHHHSTNMIYKHMQNLKKIVMRAFNDGLFRQNPFGTYKDEKRENRFSNCRCFCVYLDAYACDFRSNDCSENGRLCRGAKYRSCGVIM